MVDKQKLGGRGGPSGRRVLSHNLGDAKTLTHLPTYLTVLINLALHSAEF